MDWYKEYVTNIPGAQGGSPMLRGTRAPVATVAAYLENDHGDLAVVPRALRHLNERQIRVALAYAEAHRAEVDANEDRHDRALQEVLAAR